MVVAFAVVRGAAAVQSDEAPVAEAVESRASLVVTQCYAVSLVWQELVEMQDCVLEQ
jgi:hypothetical protein